MQDFFWRLTVAVICLVFLTFLGVSPCVAVWESICCVYPSAPYTDGHFWSVPHPSPMDASLLHLFCLFHFSWNSPLLLFLHKQLLFFSLLSHPSPSLFVWFIYFFIDFTYFSYFFNTLYYFYASFTCVLAWALLTVCHYANPFTDIVGKTQCKLIVLVLVTTVIVCWTCSGFDDVQFHCCLLQNMFVQF